MDQELIAYLDKRFEQIDKRFDAVDNRFEQIDKRFDAVDKRFDAVDKRFGAIDERLDTADKRFGAIDERLDTADKRMNGLEGAIRANGVQIEGLRGQIQQVAEGVAVGNENLAAFRTEVDQKFEEMRQIFNTSHSNLHSRVSALEARRVRKVERRT